MIRRRSRKKRFGAVSLGASMADMAMLLLVFFMATTTTEPPVGAEVNLPKAVTEGAEQDSIYLSLSAKGNLYYEGEAIKLTQLKNKLSIRGSEKDKIVALTADKNLSYEKIDAVLNELKKLDFLNVVFMAETRQGLKK